MNNFNERINEWIQSLGAVKKWKSARPLGPLYALIITAIFGAVMEWFALIPLNLRSIEFISFAIFLLLVYVFLAVVFTARFNAFVKLPLLLAAALFFYNVFGGLTGLKIFNADRYQSQLLLDSTADFYADNEAISFNAIPVVDRQSSIVLGDRKMGEIVDYVSQFEVNQDYIQINYKNTPYRVTPLEYTDLIRWFTNRKNGLPAYITVNMVTQKVEVVELEQGMKYSESEPLFRNIYRHLRFNYPTLMFEELSFEIDENGTPYYIAPVYNYTIGIFGGKDIVGAVLVNAIDGSSEYYDIDQVPTWVDRVYPASLINQQLINWGKYKNGFFNSVLAQKGVLQPTEGYNYVALNDDVYFYTGLTSATSDASNVGFALVNLRTKDAKYYGISGAEEFSAMSSAEGQVQHLGYKATFPILINSGGVPTYFLSLKDNANLVKKYAFVSVENYQIVATGDSVLAAQTAYVQLLKENGILNGGDAVIGDVTTIEGVVSEISSAVIEGNSTYYFKLEGQDLIFISDISLNSGLPLLKAGKKVAVSYLPTDDSSVVVSTLEIK